MGNCTAGRGDESEANKEIQAHLTGSYAETVGDGTTTMHPINHNLGTNDVFVQVYKISTGENVECGIVRTSINAVSVMAFPAFDVDDARVIVKAI